MALLLQGPATLPGSESPWTARSVLGLALYLGLFAAALYGIWRLARPLPGERPEGEG